MGFNLLILRHAHAGSREEFTATRRPDHLRPLTPRGKREMKSVAQEIAKILPDIEFILSSPYVRAKQTAKLLHKKYPKAHYLEVKQLKPFVSAKSTTAYIKKIRGVSALAVVGHEPHLSKLLSFILTGATHTDFDIKKGGFAIVEFKMNIQEKQARLKCLVQPAQLKKIKK